MTMISFAHGFKPSRGLALLIALILAFSLLLSAAFVLAELHHACTGVHCKICIAVAHSVQFLKAQSTAFLVPLMAAAFVIAFAPARYFLERQAACTDSPVTLKVKLSD